MIVIKNRELLIPNNEQFIGTVYDNNSDTRYFKLDRMLPGQIDLSNFTFVADVKYSNNTTDSISLTKDTISDDYIVLKMELPASVLSGHVGNMAIQVRCSDTSGRTWSTATANMYIMDQLSNPSAVVASTTLSSLQQTETAVEASETVRTQNETGRTTAETARVTAETARATAETARASAETARASAETARASAESTRVSQESARVTAESGRVSAESARVTAEAARVTAEAARVAEFAVKSLESEGWAKGTQNGTAVTSESQYYQNNSKYFKEQADADATTADAKRLVSEGFANGQQNGVDVTSGSPYYHNNAKYFMEQASSASGFVSYVVDQELPDASKEIARTNIDAYTKPATGIPKTDLASAVQTSLGLADTALQAHQSLSAYRTSADQDTIDATLQTKTDSSLTTTATTVVGAINEHETDISTLNTNKADITYVQNAVDLAHTHSNKSVLDSITAALVNNWSGIRPRYKDITSYFTDGSLWNRISGSGYPCPYYDIMPGDYFDMGRAVTCPDSYGSATGSQWVTVASCGGLKGNGDSVSMDYPHLVMVPGQGAGGSFHFGRHAMNDSNTTTGGYVGSKMYTDVLGAVVSSGATSGTINQQLYYIFGSHLQTTRELLSNSINSSGYNRIGENSGCSNSWAWYSCQACLMSEVEVYGSIVWSSSGYDTGTAKRQFEAFSMDEKMINNRSSYYWLKDVVSASNFAFCDFLGTANPDSASHAYYHVRPRFVIA